LSAVALLLFEFADLRKRADYREIVRTVKGALILSFLPYAVVD
jgi:hypothetical protein